MQSKIAILIVGLVILAGVGYFASSRFSGNIQNGVEELNMQEETSTGSMSDEAVGGVMLAGKNSMLYEFDQTMYQNALDSDDFVFLYFYADWCPICRVENPEIEAGFNELERADVIGFRVNFKDDDTSDQEEALAKEFTVPYQHTKIILKGGEEIFRSGEQWDKQEFLSVVGGI